MKHHFISIYYNKYKDDDIFYNCLEFIKKYPFITLIEVVFGDDMSVFSHKPNVLLIRIPRFEGFVNNKIINWYLKEYEEDIKSLTCIDADLILPEDFKEQVIRLVNSKKEACFIQPFLESCEKYKDPNVKSLSMKSAGYEWTVHKRLPVRAHTGYIYSYNRYLLDKLDWKLPEKFILGGFDTILWLSITGCDYMIKQFIDNNIMNREIEKFYNKIVGVDTDFLPFTILHNEHGNKASRYTGRFELYNKVYNSQGLINPVVLNKYFMKRSGLK